LKKKFIHSYTSYVHNTGSAGDLRSARYTKNLWEKYLGLRITNDDESLVDAGTKESREFLTGRRRQHKDHDEEVIEENESVTYFERMKRRARGAWSRTKAKLTKLQTCTWVFIYFIRTQHSAPAHIDKSQHSKTLPNPFISQPRVWIDTYYPYINYPLRDERAIRLFVDGESVFSASLLEDVLEEDPTSKFANEEQPSFHAMYVIFF
jgi:N-acetylated-alpha-linked acidic dipeptidase